MQRPSLAGWCLLAVALMAPLGFGQLPMAQRGAEVSWSVAADSLLTDGDLRLETADLERHFRRFPYGGPIDLAIVDDGGNAPRIDRPLPYTLLVAAAVGLLGRHGPLVLGMLSLWLATFAIAGRWRRQTSERTDGWRTADDPTSPADASLAALAAATAVLLSGLTLEAFWIAPAASAAAFVALACAARDARMAAIWLALATSLSPWAGTLALPALASGALFPDQQRRGVLSRSLLMVALGLALAQAIGLGTVDGARVIHIDSPWERPWLEMDTSNPAGDAAPEALAAANAPLDGVAEAGRRLAGGWIDRRTGFLPYFPLVLVLAPSLWRAARRRSTRWLLATLVAVVVVRPFLPAGEHLGAAGAEMIADPRLAVLWPAWLALARPPRLIPLLSGCALGGLLLTPALATPLLPPVPDVAIHHHERGWPWRHLPLDPRTVGRGGSFTPVEIGSNRRLWLPGVAAKARNDEVWLLGGERAELYLDLPAAGLAAPAEAMVIDGRSWAVPNVVEITLGNDTRTWTFAGDGEARVSALGTGARDAFALGAGRRITAPDGEARRVIELTASSQRGARPIWGGRSAATEYVGVTLAVLGTPDDLATDGLTGVEWLGCGAPQTVTTGEAVRVLARLRNGGPRIWPTEGAARMRLGARLGPAVPNNDADENARAGDEARDAEATSDGLSRPLATRVDLGDPVGPGDERTVWLDIEAPSIPGRIVVDLDLVFERVAWLSERGAPTCRMEIEVTAKSGGA
ncbi:MAG: hypothetical protein AAGN46_16850, partial [Acidobacteriota bacterium]